MGLLVGLYRIFDRVFLGVFKRDLQEELPLRYYRLGFRLQGLGFRVSNQKHLGFRAPETGGVFVLGLGFRAHIGVHH